MITRFLLCCSLLGFLPVTAKDFFYMGAYEQRIMPDYVYRPPKPFMWNARLKVDRSIIIGYERLFHSFNKYVEAYTGISGNYLETWRTETDHIYALSTYLCLKLHLIRSSSLNLSILYSPAGPTLLSKTHFVQTGFSNHFVFQNQIGIAISSGKTPEYEFFIKLYHYSNGDLFPVNGGIDIPILLGLSCSI